MSEDENGAGWIVWMVGLVEGVIEGGEIESRGRQEKRKARTSSARTHGYTEQNNQEMFISQKNHRLLFEIISQLRNKQR